MEEVIKTAVEMTAEEKAQFEAYKAEKAKKEAEARRKTERETYSALVEETIDAAIPTLQSISEGISETKRQVLESFRAALEMKSELFNVKKRCAEREETDEDEGEDYRNN